LNIHLPRLTALFIRHAMRLASAKARNIYGNPQTLIYWQIHGMAYADFTLTMLDAEPRRHLTQAKPI
jgi:Na+/H+ antiporter NhaD/arsenite permease-like protein